MYIQEEWYRRGGNQQKAGSRGCIYRKLCGHGCEWWKRSYGTRGNHGRIYRNPCGVTANGGCADHTAAAPYTGQECTYKYTITAVNKATGEVTGNLYCTSVNGATDGVTKDSSGRLIGYQRVSGTAVIHRSYKVMQS